MNKFSVVHTVQSRFINWIAKIYHPRTLGAKLILPIVVLMGISLIGSTMLFIVGTNSTQEQIVGQQVQKDSIQVEHELQNRIELVQMAATLLANDIDVQKALQLADTNSSLATLNKRAMVVRDRFELDLIQIYNQSGETRTNLVVSSLYKQSSLLSVVQEEKSLFYESDGRLLYLARVNIPNQMGSVLVGLDLQNELERIIRQEFLSEDVGLRVSTSSVLTNPVILFGSKTGQFRDTYTSSRQIDLHGKSAELVLSRKTTEIRQVTRTGMWLLIGSLLLTSVLVAGIALLVTRAIARPVQKLSHAVEKIAGGDISVQLQAYVDEKTFSTGSEDEIGVLTRAFNVMTIELSGLYQNLEKKVEERTRQLTAAQKVARATSSSLDLREVLKTSVELICESFGFYHASIFTIEPGSEVARLRESSSVAGQTLIAHNHRLKIGSKSLVGQATATRKPVIVQKVQENPTHFRNPFLPDTRSEAVFPLMLGDTLIGALDVQSTEENAFTAEIVSILVTLADQLSVAVQNARLYEKQIIDSHRLTEVDKVKGQYLERISLQMRRPLEEIQRSARNLQKIIQNLVPEHQFDALVKIQTTSEQLLGLVNDIRDITQIDTGQLGLKFEPVSIPSLIEGILAAAQPLVQHKSINLLNTISSDIPVVLADKSRLKQVLLNLLQYSIRQTTNGFIILRARTVDLMRPGAERMEPFVEIAITDTSSGLSKDKQEHLFDPFTEMGTENPSEPSLSLSLARQLVLLHNGRIWVESMPGQGCTFTFILPVSHTGRSGKIDLSIVNSQEVSYAA